MAMIHNICEGRYFFCVGVGILLFFIFFCLFFTLLILYFYGLSLKNCKRPLGDLIILCILSPGSLISTIDDSSKTEASFLQLFSQAVSFPWFFLFNHFGIHHSFI